MRKFTFIVFTFLMTVVANAQTVEEIIAQQFTEYSQLVIDKKFDEALNYTNDDFFEIVPREQMKSVMESIFNMPTMEFRASLPRILKIDPIKTINGSNYARMENNTTIEMKFNQEPDQPERTPEEAKEYNDMLLSTFQTTYGKENVSFDQNSGFFTINTTKVAIAKSTDLKNWKFVVVDNPRMKTILEKFIPKELLD